MSANHFRVALRAFLATAILTSVFSQLPVLADVQVAQFGVPGGHDRFSPPSFGQRDPRVSGGRTTVPDYDTQPYLSPAGDRSRTGNPSSIPTGNNRNNGVSTYSTGSPTQTQNSFGPLHDDGAPYESAPAGPTNDLRPNRRRTQQDNGYSSPPGLTNGLRRGQRIFGARQDDGAPDFGPAGPANSLPETQEALGHQRDERERYEFEFPTSPANPLRGGQRDFNPARRVVTPDEYPLIDPAANAVRRAQSLPIPPRNGITTPLPLTDTPELSDQIRHLGTSIPNIDGGSFQAATPDAAARTGPLVPRGIRPLPPAGNRRAGSGVPAANERRFFPDQVEIEVTAASTPQLIAALQQRHRLAQIDQFTSQLSGTMLLLSRIQDGRSVAAVVRALEADAQVMSAQPNYRFALQLQGQTQVKPDPEFLQYALAKLRLPQAQELVQGKNVLVGIIDSGVDAAHPELDGAIAGVFDTIDGSKQPHPHGTAIASLIAAHARLTGAAPAARILAVRAFDSSNSNPEGSTFSILKGLDWAAINGARIINMSFAGPSDPAVHRGLEGAYKNAIVLIAAAGNAGPKSPPLYPAADQNVIAVAATDADDKVFAASNRGSYIHIAAPGVDILVAAPHAAYQISSGTSFAAAEVSGIVALMLERTPNLTASAVRSILFATARGIGQDKADAQSNPRLPDAYQAISINRPPLSPTAMR